MNLPISNRPGAFFTVSDEDAPRCKDLNWHLSKNGYLYSGKLRNYLHRFLLDAQPGQICDHIDGNTLENSRWNLRLTNASGNSRNRTGWKRKTLPKGVFPHRGRYRAMIRVNDRLIHIGMYPTPEDAARAYDGAAVVHFGEFARLNFGTPFATT
jgi:hypothetical protein